jgi:hypothetical protein
MILIADIIAVSIFVFILWDINSINNKFTLKAFEIKSEADKQDTFFSTKRDWGENNVKINNLDSYVMSSDGVANFIERLGSLTLNNGLKSEVKSISFGTVSGRNYRNIELVDIKIDVIGEWRNVEYFLEILENYPLAIDIKSFNMSKFSDYEKNNKKISQWLGSFEFTVVKLKEKK